MYKKLVGEIIQAANISDLDRIGGAIDTAFEAGKITYKDHEQLFDLIAKVSGGHYFRAGVVHIKKEG